jgi:hypothetical protein
MQFGSTPGVFDATIVNDQVDAAFAQLCDLLRQWYPALRREEPDCGAAVKGVGMASAVKHAVAAEAVCALDYFDQLAG